MASAARLPMPLQEVYEWQYDGACTTADPGAFFSPEAERGAPKAQREDAAKALCLQCPVIEQCREHALSAREPYGVWGGMTEAERREIFERLP